MKKNLFIFTTLGLLLAACNDNSGQSNTTDQGEAPSAVAPVEEAVSDLSSVKPVTTATPGPGSRTGKETYVKMISSDIPTTDPGAALDSVSQGLLQNVYDSLVAYKGASMTEYEPVLATAWSTSDDGLTHRFTLREGVKFHSGNAFSCKDAEYTFRRNLVSNNPVSANPLLSEDLLGTRQNASASDSVTWAAITAAVRCEGNDLLLTTKKPDPYFISKIITSAQGIVDSAHAIAIGDWDGTEATWKAEVGKDLATSALAKKPSGTGAYQVVKSDSSGMTFKAFEDHWNGPAPIKNVIVQVVPETSSHIQAFLSGDADEVSFGSRETIQNQVAGQPGVTIIDNLPDTAAFGLAMNQDTSNNHNITDRSWGTGLPANFFADEDMRKCFVYAFDWPAYIQQVQLGKGEQYNMLLLRGFFGYDENIPPVGHDLLKAEAHCKKAHGGEAWDKGFSLNVAYSQNQSDNLVAIQILKARLEELNPKFRINPIGKQWSEILDDSKIEAMQTMGWGALFPDPDSFVRSYYHSEGTYAPHQHIGEPDFDKLIDAARAAGRTEEAAKLYSEITRHVQEKAYNVQIPTSLAIMAHHSNLQGLSAETYNPLAPAKWHSLSKTE